LVIGFIAHLQLVITGNYNTTGARGTSRKVACSSPDEVNFSNLPNPYRRTIALGSTEPLTEMRGKGRPARKADNLTAICEPIV
jgi:hypothetical protein